MSQNDREYYNDSDLVSVYKQDYLVGHMWYRTFIDIYGSERDTMRLEYSKHNCSDNVAEYNKHYP